jgi:hypothetical protein
MIKRIEEEKRKCRGVKLLAFVAMLMLTLTLTIAAPLVIATDLDFNDSIVYGYGISEEVENRFGPIIKVSSALPENSSIDVHIGNFYQLNGDIQEETTNDFKIITGPKGISFINKDVLKHECFAEKSVDFKIWITEEALKDVSNSVSTEKALSKLMNFYYFPTFKKKVSFKTMESKDMLLGKYWNFGHAIIYLYIHPVKTQEHLF